MILKIGIAILGIVMLAACDNLHSDELGHEYDSYTYDDKPTIVSSKTNLANVETCSATSVGMSVRLLNAATGAEADCVRGDTDYELEVYGSSQNFAYCLEEEDGFTVPFACKDSSSGDISGSRAYDLMTDATLPAPGISGVVKPGCGGVDTFVERFEFEFRDCALGVSQVPEMTGNNSPAGNVTRSGVHSSSYEGWRAFESGNAAWLSKTWQSPAWLAYRWDDGPRRITSYSIKFTNGSLTSRAPRDWTLQGKLYGSWVVLDRRTNQANWSSGEAREYTVTSPGSFEEYRIHVTRDNDSRSEIVVVSVGYLEFFGKKTGGSSPPGPECGDGICEVGENPLNCPDDCDLCTRIPTCPL